MQNSEFTNKCPNCNAVMTHDKMSEMLICDYCGTIIKVAESDEVKTARIQAQARKEADIEKQKIESEYNARQQEINLKHEQIDLKKEEINKGIETIRTGAHMIDQGAQIANTASRIIKMIVALAAISVIIFVILLVGCIAKGVLG
ncbi:MAG: hypothetical protein IKT14_06540 [Clostridiales bacterium]|nr:hypothetical protein [Clostridiales bacterium]